MSSSIQEQTHRASLSNPAGFWLEQSKKLTWAKPPTRALDIDPQARGGDKWRWFPDSAISTTHNCLTRHVDAGHGARTALIWDSPVTNTHNVRISYRQLLDDVQTLAGVLRGLGVEKGDRVLVYMPMIPPAVTAMLATAHLGAVHSVVFGGFAPAECAKRIADCDPTVIVTATCGIEGARVIPYMPLIREAIALSGLQGKGGCKLLVWQRPQCPAPLLDGERDWASTVRAVKKRAKIGAMREALGQKQKIVAPAVTLEPTVPVAVKKELPESEWRPVEDGVAVAGNDPLYTIYTSGTTGMPKGVVREAAGHAVGLNFQINYLFGINAGDVIFTASDIGWVVGHSYIVYAPLLAGATTVLFEGKPVGTPAPDTFWRICADYKVNVLSTAPTALRAIRREDSTGALLAKHNLRSLRALFLAGERSEAAVVDQFNALLATHAAPHATVVDNWWSTESGSPMSGIALGVPVAQRIACRPGSAGKPMPGWDIRAVDDAGNEVPRGTMGNIVLGMPLAPTGFRTLWRDAARYETEYLRRFAGRCIDTGDAGMVDADGYVHILARTDDVINVAAHRFSTGALEQAVLAHPRVAECCVVGVPDALKGHVPFALVHLNHVAGGGEEANSSEPDNGKLYAEVNALVRAQIGAIASLAAVLAPPRANVKIIPKTRSGKTLRRVVRELVEGAARGEPDVRVKVPPTVEDAEVVEHARDVVKAWFARRGGRAKL